MNTSRECLGCGGTGRQAHPERCRHVACCGYTANVRRVVPAIDSQRCKADVLYGDERCAMTREDRESYCAHHRTLPCPVCLGSGRVEDRIGVEDAVADAETLRLFALVTVNIVQDEWDWRADQPEFAAAEGILRCQAPFTFGHIPSEFYFNSAIVWLETQEAARAAFRAVPGLRGE